MRKNFRFFGINPESYYLGKPVEVIGKVRMYKGRPEIRIGHPISIIQQCRADEGRLMDL
jgi:DNA/RNA endonuclease YhcR with UshA esterase domain